MILWGIPNWTIIFSLMKFATAPPVALQSGMAFAHLMKYSVTTRIHMYPWEGGLTSSTKIKPLSVEGPWCDHAMQALWVSVDQIGPHLATMALFHKFYGILLHSGPVVAHMQYAPIQLLLSLMLSTFSFVHFL